MLALDVARVEAGLLLIDVDFFSSKKALIESQKYTPYEMGLGRLVSLTKGRFIGQQALRAEHQRGPARQVVGLEIDWTGVEAIYETLGLPPTVGATASRVAVPVYRGGRQVGRATTTTWSPVLKKMIALATVDRPHFAEGTVLEIEVTVEAVRHRVNATVVPTPFFNPPRKTASPPCSCCAVPAARRAITQCSRVSRSALDISLGDFEPRVRIAVARFVQLHDHPIERIEQVLAIGVRPRRVGARGDAGLRQLADVPVLPVRHVPELDRVRGVEVRAAPARTDGSATRRC